MAFRKRMPSRNYTENSKSRGCQTESADAVKLANERDQLRESMARDHSTRNTMSMNKREEMTHRDARPRANPMSVMQSEEVAHKAANTERHRDKSSSHCVNATAYAIHANLAAENTVIFINRAMGQSPS